MNSKVQNAVNHLNKILPLAERQQKLSPEIVNVYPHRININKCHNLLLLPHRVKIHRPAVPITVIFFLILIFFQTSAVGSRWSAVFSKGFHTFTPIVLRFGQYTAFLTISDKACIPGAFPPGSEINSLGDLRFLMRVGRFCTLDDFSGTHFWLTCSKLLNLDLSPK